MQKYLSIFLHFPRIAAMVCQVYCQSAPNEPDPGYEIWEPPVHTQSLMSPDNSLPRLYILMDQDKNLKVLDFLLLPCLLPLILYNTYPKPSIVNCLSLSSSAISILTTCFSLVLLLNIITALQCCQLLICGSAVK